MHSDNVSTTAGESRDRKSTKPLMEKRRRARINASLAELKSLLLEVIKKEGARHSKMEKADILEMTVKHLREIQKRTFTDAVPNDPTVGNKHNLGFSECAQEVSRYLSTVDECDTDLRTRLLEHLANTITGYDSSDSPPPSTSGHVTPPPSYTSLPVQSTAQPVSSTAKEEPSVPQIVQPNPFALDLNNNVSTLPSQQTQTTKLVSGLQVIPTKLHTGELAFVVPANVLASAQTPNYVIPVYASQSSSQSKPTFAMTMSGTSTSSPLMIVSSSDVFQTCPVASFPGNINIIAQSSLPSAVSISQPTNSDSSIRALSPPRARVDTSDLRLHEGAIHPILDLGRQHGARSADGACHQDGVRQAFDDDPRHHDVRNIRHLDLAGQPMWRPW